MSGANTPRSKKRIRQALIDMMRAHQKGKPISMTALKVITLIGVIDGYFPPEAACFQRPKGVKGLGRYAEGRLGTLRDAEGRIGTLRDA